MAGFDAEQKPIFDVRALIIVNETYILLDVEDLSIFFIQLRRQPEYANLSGGETYFDYVTKESMANFFFEQRRTSYVISYANYANGNTYEVEFPNQEMIKHILSIERILIGYMNLKVGLEQEKDEMVVQLEDIRLKCPISPMFIKTLAENSSNNFVVEIATNLFAFFVKYWEINQQQ